MKVLVIIPAYNEELNITPLIRELQAYKDLVDTLVINDHSGDKTSEYCRRMNVQIMDLPCNLGIGGAVQTGYKHAEKNGYDIAIQVDGDGQHVPSYIPSLIAPIKQGKADFVIGSRYINKEGFQSSKTRQFGIKFFSKLLLLLTKKEIKDPTSGFRACNREIIELFAQYYPSDYPEPESIMHLVRKKYRIAEVPVVMKERIQGKSSITSLKSIYYMIKVTLAICIDWMRSEQEKEVIPT